MNVETVLEALRRAPGRVATRRPLRFASHTLRGWMIATLAYGVAVGLVAGCVLPAVLKPLPVVVALPKPPPEVARTPMSVRAAP